MMELPASVLSVLLSATHEFMSKSIIPGAFKIVAYLCVVPP